MQTNFDLEANPQKQICREVEQKMHSAKYWMLDLEYADSTVVQQYEACNRDKGVSIATLNAVLVRKWKGWTPVYRKVPYEQPGGHEQGVTNQYE